MADMQTWTDYSRQIIDDCMNYAKAGVWNETTDNNIRTIRVTIQMLQSALSIAGQVQRPTGHP
jgi:hypothetical protein